MHVVALVLFAKCSLSDRCLYLQTRQRIMKSCGLVTLVLALTLSLGMSQKMIRSSTYTVSAGKPPSQGSTETFINPATSLDVTLTSYKTPGDRWSIYTGPAEYCLVFDSPDVTKWPFTRVFSGLVDILSPVDTGNIPGGPTNEFCVAVACANSKDKCGDIEVRVRLYASSPSHQSCGGGVFADPPSSLAKESDVFPGYKCAYPADDGDSDDHDNFPLITVAPEPNGKIETLRWCKGTSVCLKPSPSTTPAPASSCPDGMVPTVGSPSNLCFNVPLSQCKDWLHGLNREAYVVTPANVAVADYVGTCWEGDGTCGFACEDCTFECMASVSAPTTTPSASPSRSPSSSPSRSPAQSSTPGSGGGGRWDAKSGSFGRVLPAVLGFPQA